MTPGVPLVTAAAGCGGTGRELARFGDLGALDAFLLGPVGLPGGAPPRASVSATPSGLVHRPAPVLPVDRVVEEMLPWLRARGLSVVVAVRGSATGVVADTLHRLRRSLDFTAVAGVEIDLAAAREATHPAVGGLAGSAPAEPWSADPQACLKLLSAAREQLPRNVVLRAKLGGECPDPVATARAAVGGGARVLVLSGAVPTGAGQQLVGPAVGPVTLGLVSALRAAIAAGRVPAVRLIAVGGIYDVPSALAARGAGADGVQVGCGILSDPEVLWRVQQALSADAPEDHDSGPATPSWPTIGAGESAGQDPDTDEQGAHHVQ